MTLAVITYLWAPAEGSPPSSFYTPDDVRRLQRDVARI